LNFLLYIVHNCLSFANNCLVITGTNEKACFPFVLAFFRHPLVAKL